MFSFTKMFSSTPAPVAAPQPVPAKQVRETIIVADDDMIVRNAVCAVLRKLGYRVLEAESGVEAVRIAETETGPIDMVLADVVMPSMTTEQLRVRLTAAQPRACIAFMSGYIHDDLVRREVLKSAVPFFEKPFTVPSLARQVREVLDERRN